MKHVRILTSLSYIALLAFGGGAIASSLVNQTQQSLCLYAQKDGTFHTLKPGFCYKDKTGKQVVIHSNNNCSGNQTIQNMNDDNTYCITDTTGPTVQPCTAACGQKIPPGDYQKSCSKCSLTSNKFMGPDNVLQCYCTYDEQGVLKDRKSQLPLDAAKANLPISNCNGHLVYGACQPVPAGSYQTSCSACFMKDAGTLDCSYCTHYEKGKTQLQSALLAIPPNSQEDIKNCNGTLQYGNC
jgi:hypothetical protein